MIGKYKKQRMGKIIIQDVLNLNLRVSKLSDLNKKNNVPFVTRYYRKKRIKKIIPYLSKEMKILDLGCGDGWLTNHLIEQEFDCVGLDINIEPNDTFYNGNVNNLPFSDNHFDCIIMIEVIEHISPSHYSEINRILKDKGLIILSTILPESNSFVHLMEKLGIVNKYVTPHVNLVHIEKLPWKLIESSKILLLDQFGVFEKPLIKNCDVSVSKTEKV